jgi:hypothetical protein
MDVEDYASSQSVLLGTFISESRYSVPSLQRNYSWSTEEAGQLWSDLSLHLASGTGYYFLGNIIFFGRDAGRVVVDGQQRLATATLLLCAARDAIHGAFKDGVLAPSLEVDIHDDEITLEDHLAAITLAVKELGKKDRFRITLKQNDEERLRWIQTLEGKRPKQPHSRGRPKIYRVYSQFLTTAKALANKDDIGQLCALTDLLLNRVVITRTKVPDLLTAYTIFSTVNNRGKDLTLADIVRAEILHRWEKISHSAASTEIEQMLNQFDLLEYDDLPQFMRRYWILRTGEKTSTTETSKQIVDLIQSFTTKKSIKEFVAQMARMVEAYARYIEIQAGYPKGEAERRLAILGLSGFAQHIPAMMAVIDRGELESKSTEELLTTIEAVYLYQNVLLDSSPSDIEDMFAALAHRVYKDGAADGRKELAESFAKIVDKAKQLRGWFVREFAKSQLSDKSAAFVLRRIEKSRWNKELRFDLYRPKSLNLEHILPQSPDSKGWPAKWSDEEVLNPVLWLPGNLTLLAQPLNARLQNAGFGRKKKEGYAKSDVKLTRELLTFTSWDEQSIAKRGRALADEAANLWAWDNAIS